MGLMSEAHKHNLNVNRVQLMKNVQCLSRIFELLRQDYTLTGDMLSEIQVTCWSLQFLMRECCAVKDLFRLLIDVKWCKMWDSAKFSTAMHFKISESAILVEIYLTVDCFLVTDSDISHHLNARHFAFCVTFASLMCCYDSDEVHIRLWTGCNVPRPASEQIAGCAFASTWQSVWSFHQRVGLHSSRRRRFAAWWT